MARGRLLLSLGALALAGVVRCGEASTATLLAKTPSSKPSKGGARGGAGLKGLPMAGAAVASASLLANPGAAAAIAAGAAAAAAVYAASIDAQDPAASLAVKAAVAADSAATLAAAAAHDGALEAAQSAAMAAATALAATRAAAGVATDRHPWADDVRRAAALSAAHAARGSADAAGLGVKLLAAVVSAMELPYLGISETLGQLLDEVKMRAGEKMWAMTQRELLQTLWEKIRAAMSDLTPEQQTELLDEIENEQASDEIYEKLNEIEETLLAKPTEHQVRQSLENLVGAIEDAENDYLVDEKELDEWTRDETEATRSSEAQVGEGMSSAQPHQGRVQGDLARKSWLEQLYKQEAVSRPNPPDASNGGNSAGLKSIKTRKIWQSVPAALSSKSKSLPAAAAAALPLATPAASAAVAAAAAAAATVYAAAIDRGDKLEPVAKAMAAAAIKASASASNAAKAGKARIAAVAAEAATVCSVAARALAGYSAPLEAEAEAAAAVAAAETAVAAGGSTAVVQRVAEDAFTPFLGLGKTLKRVMVSAADRVKESSGQEVWSDEGRAEATALWASVVAVMKMPMDLNSFGSRATALESEDYPEAVLEVIWSKLGQIQSTLSGQKKEWVPPLAVQDLGPALIDGADGDEGALEGAKEPAAASKEGLKGLKLPKQPMGVRGGRGTRGADAPGQGPQSSSGDEASSILADVAGVGAGFVSGMGAMGIASFGYHKLAGGGRMALQRSSIGARAGAAPRANAGAMSC